jgi:4-amino-4-deoxy-L-arabinose transferase-like glycosyltransferase
VLRVAALLRLANLHALSSSPFFRRPVLDGVFCDRWALGILAGQAPASPFYQDPLYPYFLAFVYRLFGHEYGAVYVLQTLLGLATVALVADLTRRLFGPWPALAAGALAAAYRPFIFYESQIEKTAVALALVALWLWVSVLALQRRGRLASLASGVALGLACLTRGNLLVFVVLQPLLIACAPSRPTPGGAPGGGRIPGALVLAGALAVLAPVAIRNSLLGGEFLLTTTQIGQNLYAGNNPANRDGQNGTPPWVRTSPDFEEGDFAAYAEQVQGRSLSRREVSLFYARAAARWAIENPRSFLGLALRKAALYLSRVEVPDNQDLDFFGRYSPVLRAPLPGFGAVFALGFAGMALFGRGGAARSGLLSFFWVYALATVTFFVLSRYRVLALPALLPFAGAFTVWFAEAVIAAAGGRGIRLAAKGLAYALAGFGLTLAPVAGVDPAVAGAQTLVNLGAQYYEEGNLEAAEKSFREALALDPLHAAALRSFGVLAFRKGDQAGAYDFLERAVTVNSEDPVARYYLGMIREARGELSAAAVDYAAAARLLPGREDVRDALTRVLAKQGDTHPAPDPHDPGRRR